MKRACHHPRASSPALRIAGKAPGSFRQAGIALVVTLAILVLMMGLTVALLLTASNERRSAALYKSSQGLRELADTSVNLVMAQIQEATTATAGLPPEERQTWASQPGMIRTYDTSTVNSYKLYSWANPTMAGDADDAVPNDWFQSPAIFTDLNEPLPDSEDPADETAFRYPIAYPPPTGPEAPAGYSINANAPLSTGSGFQNPVPMPVQWLYVLQDGTLQYPTPGTGSTATITGASEDNPIVARVAFWTDDETSKVNLNTAAGGEYWAPPVQRTALQFSNSLWQPTRWEFQRYPGHPARTDVQRAFPDLSRNQIWSLIPRVSDNNADRTTVLTAAPESVPYDMDRLFASVGETRFGTAANEGLREDFLDDGEWADRIERSQFLITTASRAPETTRYGTPRVAIWPISSFNTTARRTALDRLIAFCATIRNSGAVDNPEPYYFVRSTPEAIEDDVEANEKMFGYLEEMSDVDATPGFPATSLTAKYTVAGRNQLLTQFYDYIRNTNRQDVQLAGGNRFVSGFAGVAPPVRRTVDGVETFGFGKFATVNQIAIQFICTADGDIPVFPDWNSTTNYGLGSEVTYGQRYWRAIKNAGFVEPGNQDAEGEYPWFEIYHRSLWTAVPPAQPEAPDDPSYPDPRLTAPPVPLPPDIHPDYRPILPGQRNIMAMAILEMAMPASSYPSIDYRQMHFRVQGMDQLRLNGQLMGFPAEATLTTRMGSSADTGNINVGDGGGVLKFLAFFVSSNVYPSGGIIPSRTSPPVARAGFSLGGGYPLASQSVRVPNNQDMVLSGETTQDPNTSEITYSPAEIQVETLWPATTSPEFATQTIPFPVADVPVPSLPTNQALWVYYPNGWDETGPASLSPEVTSGRFPIANPGNWDVDRLILKNHDSFVAVATAHGDYRLSMVRPQESVHWGLVPPLASRPSFAHRLFDNRGSNLGVRYDANYDPNAFGLLAPRGIGPLSPIPTRDELDALGFAHPLTYGDFDNGLPNHHDGPFINASDEVGGWAAGSGTWAGLYWVNVGYIQHVRPIHHTPNRKIASAVAFGSLPSAAVQDRPWQNLLFRPAPGVDHPGQAGFNIDGTSNSDAPADHHWLDFFWMPVVEPYAISETFSTAGKINMNYRIAPFSYIQRTTGLEAVLGSSGVTAVPSAASFYQNSAYVKASSITFESLFDVNIAQTLNGFRARMNANDLFRAANELCELPIVPVAPAATFGSLRNGAWGMNYRYTGDNTKERTYNDIYPRLTTRSNTYTVHYRVQTLQKRTDGDQGEWDEGNDTVVSELRGNTLIERYLDPNAIYPDYAADFTTAESMDALYRFRILQRADFTP